jgi:hypothetical protein
LHYKNIIIKVPLADNQGKKQIKVEYKPKHIKIVVSGQTIVDGELEKSIKVEHSMWVSETICGRISLFFALMHIMKCRQLRLRRMVADSSW